RGHRFLHTANGYLGIAFMSVDDVYAAPVPKLHVHRARAVLMETGDDQPAANARQLAGQIQRPLLAGAFEGARAQSTSGELLDPRDDLPVVVHFAEGVGAQALRQSRRAVLSGNRDHARTGLLGKLYESRAQEAGPRDGHVMTGPDI